MSKYSIDIQMNKEQLKNLVREISKLEDPTDDELYRVFKENISDKGDMFSKSAVIVAYRKLKVLGDVYLSADEERKLLHNIKMKKTRTISGVTPVTVLTKPFPCPGKCIFCPNDVRMPKSYLSNEPGAQRAGSNKFDPYLQNFNRLVAFRNTGHPTDKVELLILGGTWSSYPESYRIWFVKRCFDAMNDFDSAAGPIMLDPETVEMPFDEEKLDEVTGADIQRSYNQVVSKASSGRGSKSESATWDELFDVHHKNERSSTKCVGLVIETRPDEIDEQEVKHMRMLGATKVQIGVQSLNNQVLKMNKRGHDVQRTEEAFLLLRQAGFKILAHWMPNLYGSSPEEDIADYRKLFVNEAYRPDELKIYPCSLIESAELMRYYKNGSWKPYTEDELMHVAVNTMPITPRYCRLTRVIRDIPSTDIVDGNKKTNFRQLAEKEIQRKGLELKDIRSREVKSKMPSIEELELKTTTYKTAGSTEHFLEYVTVKDEVAGFLRLSIPTISSFMEDIKDMPMIREVHVYGKSAEIGDADSTTVQHRGIGKRLIEETKRLCLEKGYTSVAVISSVGTREYYKKRGFEQKGLYQICEIRG